MGFDFSEYKVYEQPTSSLTYCCNDPLRQICCNEDSGLLSGVQSEDKFDPILLNLLLANKIVRTKNNDLVKIATNISDDNSPKSSRISLINDPADSTNLKKISNMYLQSGSSIPSISKLAYALSPLLNLGNYSLNESSSNHNDIYSSSLDRDVEKDNDYGKNATSLGYKSIADTSRIDTSTSGYSFLTDYNYSLKHKPWNPVVSIPTTEDSNAVKQDLINDNLSVKQYLRFFDLHNRTRHMPDIYTGNTSAFDFSDSSKSKLKNSFCNFSYCEVIYGEECVPPLIGHSTVAIGDKLVIIGGVRGITDNFKISNKDKVAGLSNENNLKDKIRMKGVKYPYPLNDDILNNPWYVNNEKIYIMDNDTNVVRSIKLHSNNDVPPCLCFATCTVITDRYFLYYGGFEIITSLVHESNSVLYLERDIEVNDKAWIFDIITFKFVKIDLDCDDTCGIQGFPINLARFAHSVSAPELKLETLGKQDSLNSHADFDFKLVLDPQKVEKSTFRLSISFYVFGGYTYKDNKNNSQNPKEKKRSFGKKMFATSSYFFKIKVWFNTNNMNNNLEFVTKGKYLFIEAYNKGPTPRGFHASILLKESNLPGSFSSKQYSKPVKHVNNHFTANDLTDHVFLVHGGTNLSSIFGDLWRFNFNTMTWKCVNTRLPKFIDGFPEEEIFIKSDLHRANHSMVMLDEFLLFIGGFNSFSTEKQLIQARTHRYKRFAEDYQRDWMLEVQDVIDELMDSKDHKFNCNIFLDLNTSTWYFPKLDERIMEYVNFNGFFKGESNNLLNHLKNIIFEEKIESIESFVHESQMEVDKLLDLLILLKQKQLFFEDRCILGGTVSFINRKLYSIGGVVLPKQHYKNSKKLLPLLGQNILFGLIIISEMPVFVQPFLAKSR